MANEVKNLSQTHDLLSASTQTYAKNQFVIVNSAGNAVIGANTANAVLGGVALESKVTAGTHRVDRIKTEISGCQVECDHTANLSGGEEGDIVFIAGPESVAATGNVQAGRILEVLATGAGTSRVLIQLNKFAHSDVSTA
jgi:hypothetical protein